MELSALEKWMYRVMSAIYESGIPIDFKGAMVLKACLLEAGYPHEIRHTLDIDANWYTTEKRDRSGRQAVQNVRRETVRRL